MRGLVSFLIALATFMAGPACAQTYSMESRVEKWSPTEQRRVRVDDANIEGAAQRPGERPAEKGADRLAGSMVRPQAVAALSLHTQVGVYGPFRVTDHGSDGVVAELVAITDRASPAHFAAMMGDFPGITTLSMVEAPGTADDRANLRLGRMIRGAGLATHVPDGGSVRSSAVELFLAGARRSMDNRAEFAVHSWIDPHGRQPSDFAMNAGPNAMYLDYYREMGMKD
ncbi:MAG: hypothetical protein WA948_09475, partial [Pontixanthobacter sp.]